MLLKTNMEIKDIITYYVNTSNEVLEIDFRLVQDGDDEIRTDEVPLSELEEYGLKINHEKIETPEEIEDDFDDMMGLDDDFDSEIIIDDLIPFLNEYYTVHPERLPDVSLF